MSLIPSAADGSTSLFKWDAISSKLVIQSVNGVKNGESEIGSLKHQINLRLDRPIEGCELKPRVYVYSTQRTSTGIANKAYSQSDHIYEFKWYRGPERQACANSNCPRAASFSPLEWSTHALQGCRVQCVICNNLKVSRHKSIFCNAKCFQRAWKDHQITHATAKEQIERNIMLLSDVEVEVGGLEDSEVNVPSQDLDQLVLSDNEEEEEVNTLNAFNASGTNEAKITSESLLSKSEAFLEVQDMQGDEKWVLISTNRCIVPSPADVGHCLRLDCWAVLPDLSLVCNPRSMMTEPVLCIPPLPPRGTLIGSSEMPTSGGMSQFRVISYNLLAEIYATQQAFPLCDFWALSWNYRRANLAREILDVEADVLSLQEVQADAFRHFFQPLLDNEGFDGVYKAKTRESMGSLGKVDGCALFWRRSRFLLVENYGIEFNECARRSAAPLGRSTDRSNQYVHRLSKDNIAQIVVLEMIQKQRIGRIAQAPQICFVNTHLFSNPEFPDVKLWQCHTLLQELEHFVLSREVHVVLCGDFNSAPDSAVYELLSTQRVSSNRPDMVNDPCHVISDSSELSHSLPLQSAYAALCAEEPLYTNYTDSFKGTLDYIWYSTPDIRATSVVQVPCEEDILRCGPSMPNVAASSDHIMLCADLQVEGAISTLSPLFQNQKYYSKG